MVSKHLLAKGGQPLQDECNRYVSINGEVQAGNVVVTAPGKISCKHIIHTVGRNYDIFNTSKSAKVYIYAKQNT